MNGSFLIGGTMYFFSIVSESNLLPDFSERLNTFNFGPHFGYSYTFVFQNNTFINILSTFGINGSISKDNFAYEFQALPKFSFGYHGKRWSANLVCNFNYFTGRLGSDMQYDIITGGVGITFIRRIIQ